MNRPLLGLALGGGGARGLAHIGVLKVLEAEGIPVDCLSGSSMGGVIAAAYGAGLSAAELENEALRISRMREFAKIADIRWPARALVQGRRVRKLLVDKMGLEKSFEHLQKPVALTATDLERGETVVLKEGSVIDAVMATSAFPGLFPPVEIANRTLVDGGVLDNIPVNAVRQLGAQVVIAVDVLFSLNYDPEGQPVKIRPQMPHFLPAIAQPIYDTMWIMFSSITETRLRETQPEMILRPNVPPDLMIFLGFPRAAEAIAAGEKATREALPCIRQLLEANQKSS